MSAEQQAVIIGGTRGLGATITQNFLARNFNVTTVGRSAQSSQPHASAERHYQLDVELLDDLSAFVNYVRDGAPLKYLVFAQRYRGAGDPWAGELNVGPRATMRIVEALKDVFEPGADQAITVISSVYSYATGSTQGIGYHVSKAALNQLTRFYAATLGRRGIRVNAVVPMTYLKQDAPDWKHEQSERYREFVPLGRMPTVNEVADVADFLSSEKSSFVSGQCITVDGGTSCIWHEGLALQLLDRESAISAPDDKDLTL